MISKLTNRIKTFFHDTFFVFVNEYRSVITNGDALVIILGATLSYPLLYSYIYATNDYKRTPITIVDYSSGPKSREFIKMVAASPDINVVGKCANFMDAQQKLKAREVHAIMLVSRDFDKNIALHKQAVVSVYVDMSSFLYFKNVLLGIMETTLSKMKDIRLAYFTSQGNDMQKALMNAEPIKVQGMIMYNNQNTYATYILPGLMVLILHQTLLIGIGIIAGRQYVRRKYGFLKMVSNLKIGVFRLVIGKALCYMSLYGLLSFYAIGLIPKLFNLPDIGSSIDIMLFLLPFFLSTTFFGLSIAVFMKNDESALLLFVFSSVALLLISGPFWAPDNMPRFWQIVRWIIPSPMGLDGFVKINVLGGNLHDVRSEYVALWIQAGAYCITSVISYAFILERFKVPKRLTEISTEKE